MVLSNLEPFPLVVIALQNGTFYNSSCNEQIKKIVVIVPQSRTFHNMTRVEYGNDGVVIVPQNRTFHNIELWLNILE